MNTKIFCDIADLHSIKKFNKKKIVKGFTTNPSLMRKAGAKNYRLYSKQILKACSNKPISFEVFADDFDEMYRQAIDISSWGNNVYVKIPITNTKGDSSIDLIHNLSKNKIKVNVTAIMTVQQVAEVVDSLDKNVPSYISVFAGRIADTGVDPIPIMKKSLKIMKKNKKSELIWASPRELLNIFQADQIGCHIITVTSDILNKINLIGNNLEIFSLDTVKMFHKDSIKAGYKL